MAQQDSTPSGRVPLSEMVWEMTSDGRIVLEFLIEAMRGELDGFRPADRIAAAKELLDRGIGRPPTAPNPSGGTEHDADYDSTLAGALLAARIQAVLTDGVPTAPDPGAEE